MTSSSPPVAAAPPKKKKIPTPLEFLIGGLAGVSGWIIVHPLDVVKTRMQLAGEGVQKGPKEYRSTVHGLRTIAAKEGVTALYSGLSAGIARQCTYTTIRLGIYNSLKPMIQDPAIPANQTPFWKNALCGVVAGGTASLFSCPVEVCLIRMQGDGRIADPALRRNYKNIFDALLRVAREEGIATYWRGATPTVSRAMLVSMTQLATYDQGKQMLLKIFGTQNRFINEKSIATHFLASLYSGLIYSFLSLPLDIAKTRMQNQKPDPQTGKLEYKNLFQTIFKIMKAEGPTSLWKGYVPYFCRSGGHTIGMFIFLEQYRNLAEKYFGR